MKKLLALALAFAMVLGICLMAGCNNDTTETTTGNKTPEQTTAGEGTPSQTTDAGNPAQTTDAGNPAQTTDAGNPAQTTSTDDVVTPPAPTEWDGYTRLPGFENVDFRGEVFIIAGRTADDVGFPTDIEIYSENTDTISTAIRERNDTIEALYNCTIQLEALEQPVSFTNAEVTSGKHTIDMYPVEYSGPRLGTSGYNYNLLSLDIDFTNDWWDQNYVNSYTIKNAAGVDTLYGMVGDFALTAYTATHALFLNKTVYETEIEQALGYDIYQLVRDGKWTMDIFIEMVKKAGKDNNGNSSFSYSEGDILGWARTTHATHGLHVASGMPIISTIDGIMTFTAQTDTAAWSANIDKAIEVWSLEQAQNLGYTDVRNALTANSTLFASEVLDVLRRMKDADVTCGLVPYPKYSEAQENYAHYVDNHVSAYAIPISVVDIDTIAKFVEIYAAHSRMIVRSAWIDTYAYEYCGDADSAEMLDIILNTRTYDPAYIYFATIEAEISNMISSGKNNFSKWVDRKASTIAGEGGNIQEYVKNITEKNS